MGEILWDILPTGTRHLGGAPMNVAVHAQALGCAAAVISAVGEDDLGREAISLLTSTHGLDVAAVDVLANRPTGAVDVRFANGQPSYEFRADVAWDFLEITPTAREKAEPADAVIYGTLAQRSQASRRAIHSLLSLTRHDALRVLDVNLRPPFYDDSMILESVAQANVLKLNDGELPMVLSTLEVDFATNWVARLLDQQPQLAMIALTRGEQGSTLYTRALLKGHSLPAKPVVVKDTVGAGDAFTAALVAGLLRDRPIEILHRHASELAAFVCSQAGATPRIPANLTTV
jgi:fructokinase